MTKHILLSFHVEFYQKHGLRLIYWYQPARFYSNYTKEKKAIDEQLLVQLVQWCR